MVALRSSRLEGLFGGPLGAMTHASVASLVPNGVVESYDLEFKGQIYGRSDKEKRDLAGDVAALANTAGGVILLGIEEDDQARACAAPGVPLSDAEVGRMRQVVASQVSPLPLFDVLQVEDPAQPGHGFVVLAVPRSPAAPHAVLVNEALRFPRRNGATITYLSEPEVAHAYAARLAGIVERGEAIGRLERELVATLDQTYTFVVVTLVPDLPGRLVIDTAAWREFRESMIGKSPLVLSRSLTWRRASVGSGKLLADGSVHDDGPLGSLACRLDESGAGCIAVAVDHRIQRRQGSEIDDEDLVNAVWSGLRFLARHARDRAATGGNATVRATIWPVSQDVPAGMTRIRQYGREQVGRQSIVAAPATVSVRGIDDLAEDGSTVLATTYALSNGIVQAFGQPEVLQLTRDGRLRLRYWHRNANELEKWAIRSGVEVTQETVG